MMEIIVISSFLTRNSENRNEKALLVGVTYKNCGLMKPISCADVDLFRIKRLCIDVYPDDNITTMIDHVMKIFPWCEIIGRRFPICHVHMDGTIIEVSSFNTATRYKKGVEISHHHTKASNDCDEKDLLRLMLDPYASVVYDYMGGIEDIRKAKVRTIIPADISFREDCARILRAIRVTARLGFSISKETAHFVKNLSSSVVRLDKGRLLMEIDYMLAYGSGEASLRLLWKFGLLDILLPFQAAYFSHHGFRRRDKRTNMLLSLFSNLDKFLAPNRPCHSSLWFGILALHKALSDRPRDPLVVAAFSLAVHNGGNVLEAVKIARMINKPHDMKFPELLDLSGMDVEALEAGVRDLAESVRGALLQMTDEHFVSQAMADYPQAPHSDLVFIPLALYVKVFSIFECVKRSYDKKSLSKQDMKINYESLANGSGSVIEEHQCFTGMLV
ncbi:hypothetical protein TSUD_317990 [Trifolium subterraneum]|uniref:tRNA nucleotidyltransferase/poly(A) polymerase RNA and SrmB- binding domain-containing protein n=1 Tax=Trifolium subterraneum TaxID=3900 RepID=A0A2Z6NNH4_TRISU|nr:hypothetical protein TSUD_317990 [Trifolium subterraneum]